MSTYRLPFDCCRCNGTGCSKKAECVRYLCDEHGPRSPWCERYCSTERMEGFIPAQEATEGG